VGLIGYLHFIIQQTQPTYLKTIIFRKMLTFLLQIARSYAGSQARLLKNNGAPVTFKRWGNNVVTKDFYAF
jgi:hypothetical protein